ncbi:MAG: alpha/beta hydrolase [Afipia sp.]|nr:alpha/beta hydrolase [Afipia sp.]OJW61920.1 MAG: alpha/beta hydrolase [Afipia sp. 64-13]
MHRFHDFFCQSADGLTLHGRSTGPDSPHLPVLCLPGLTRTTADFDTIAQALATDPQTPRRVVAVDYRGRGLSDSDPNPENYTVAMEMGDVAAVAAAAEVSRAILLGTSRGGLISMALAAMRSPLPAGVILNDIGPVLELTGLMKIKGYITDPPERHGWDEAAGGLKALFADAFPALTDADWMAWAHRAFRLATHPPGPDHGGPPPGPIASSHMVSPHAAKLERTYDLALARSFDGIDPENPPPPLWELFDALQNLPLMLIHGALSDLLSPQTVQEMAARRPDLDLVEVADQGHAPLLTDAPTIARIKAFCRRCDQAAAAPTASDR